MIPTPQDKPKVAGTVLGICECPINAGSPSFPASGLKGPHPALPRCTGDQPSSRASGTGASSALSALLQEVSRCGSPGRERETTGPARAPSLLSPGSFDPRNQSLVFPCLSLFSFLSPLSKTAWRRLLPLSPRQFQGAHLILQK